MKSSCAFTLIECLISLTIITIIAAFTFPSMQQFLHRNENKLLQQTIIQLIQFSQDQAIAHSQSIDLKLTNKNEIRIVNKNNEKLIVRQLNLSSGELQIRSFPYYRDYLRFTQNGNDNGTIAYLKNDKQIWGIVLSPTGRVRVEG